MEAALDPGLLVKRNDFTEAAARAVIGCPTESMYLDNKVKSSALTQEDKLELIRHAAGMSNREGGFIVYGVENGTGRRVGICEEAFRWLSEPANIVQCFNNHFEPSKDDLLAFAVEEGGLRFVVICVPRSAYTLHMAKKDGKWSLQTNSGRRVTKHVFQQGDIPYRASGQTVSMTPTRLSSALSRMLKDHGNDILGALKGVVKRPAKSLGRLVASGDLEYQSARAVRLAVGGEAADGLVGIDVAPAREVNVQILFAYEMWQTGGGFPRWEMVYSWYAARRSIAVDDDHLRFVFQAALYCNAPPFYWGQLLDPETLEALCREAVHDCRDFHGRRTAYRVLMITFPGRYTEEYSGKDKTTCGPVRADDHERTKRFKVRVPGGVVEVDIGCPVAELEEKLEALIQAVVETPSNSQAKAAVRVLDYCLYGRSRTRGRR